jgi:hypothetical protein
MSVWFKCKSVNISHHKYSLSFIVFFSSLGLSIHWSFRRFFIISTLHSGIILPYFGFSNNFVWWFRVCAISPSFVLIVVVQLLCVILSVSLKSLSTQYISYICSSVIGSRPLIISASIYNNKNKAIVIFLV